MKTLLYAFYGFIALIIIALGILTIMALRVHWFDVKYYVLCTIMWICIGCIIYLLYKGTIKVIVLKDGKKG